MIQLQNHSRVFDGNCLSWGALLLGAAQLLVDQVRILRLVASHWMKAEGSSSLEGWESNTSTCFVLPYWLCLESQIVVPLKHILMIDRPMVPLLYISIYFLLPARSIIKIRFIGICDLRLQTHYSSGLYSNRITSLPLELDPEASSKLRCSVWEPRYGPRASWVDLLLACYQSQYKTLVVGSNSEN